MLDEANERVKKRLSELKSDIEELDSFELDQEYQECFGTVEKQIDALCKKLKSKLSSAKAKEVAVLQLQCVVLPATGKVVHFNTHRALFTLNAGQEDIADKFDQALTEVVFTCVRSYLKYNKINQTSANIAACVSSISQEMGVIHVNQAAQSTSTISRTQLDGFIEVARVFVSPAVLMQSLTNKYQVDSDHVKKCFLLTRQKPHVGLLLKSNILPSVRINRSFTESFTVTEVTSNNTYKPDVVFLRGYDLLNSLSPVNWALITQAIESDKERDSLSSFAKELFNYKIKSCEEFIHFQRAINTLVLQLVKLRLEQEFITDLITECASRTSQGDLTKHIDLELPDEQLAASLCEAMDNHDIAKIAIVCHEKANTVNCRLTNNTYLIHHAVLQGDLVSLMLLLNQDRIDINKMTQRGNTPLHLTVKSNNYEAVKMILLSNLNVDLTVKNEEGHDVVYEAAQIGNVKLIELLLQARVAQGLCEKTSVNATDIQLASTMFEGATIDNVYGSADDAQGIIDAARESGCNELVKYLVELNKKIGFIEQREPSKSVSPDISGRSRTGTQSRTSSQGSSEDGVVSEYSTTVVVSAPEIEPPLKTTELVEESADELNTAVINGETDVVYHLCKLTEVDVLLASPAETTNNPLDPFKIYEGQTYSAFQLACEYGKKDIITMILAATNAFKHSTSAFGDKTVFELALVNGHTECALILLKAAVWDVTSTTPLHLAIKYTNTDLIEELIKGFDIQSNVVVSVQGSSTSLEDEPETDESFDIIDEIPMHISHYLNSKDSEGILPIFLAMSIGNREVVLLLGSQTGF
ncbi:MAG: ankyrin repeat domain-containing protein [Shewanella sp.]|nr:ankyrin repeat domain-containing protein [Shewanella sp.]